jgi:ribonuclease P protein component
MTPEGLAATERIRRRPDFERAYDTGARLRGRYMTVFVAPREGGGPRLGVAATRKLGSAVVRNRAKRLARELFRRHKIAAAVDIVIVPRREMLDAPFASLEADYLAALARHDDPAARRRDPRHHRPRRAAAPARV